MDTFLLLYAILFTVLFLGSAIIKVVMKLSGRYEETPLMVQKEEFLTIPFVIVGIAGMFGYLLEITLFNQFFWQIYFILMLVHTVVGFLFPKMQLIKEKTTTKQFVLLSLAALTISVPMIYMLGAYAFGVFPDA